MEIFAHRGLLKDYPENSFTALTEAAKHGFGLETDLRLTKDNDFIIIHDDNFMRLTGVNRNVFDTTFSEARKLKYRNSGEHVISLRELLEWMVKNSSSCKNAIHLKVDSQSETGLRLVADYFKEFNLYERYFVFDLTKTTAEMLKKIDPKIKIALIISEYKFEPTIHLWNEVKDFWPMDIVWAAEYWNFYSEELIRDVKSRGKIFYAMSPDVHVMLGHPLARVGYEKKWDELITWGAEGICTDFPEKLRIKLNKK